MENWFNFAGRYYFEGMLASIVAYGWIINATSQPIDYVITLAVSPAVITAWPISVPAIVCYQLGAYMAQAQLR